jgi:hypothetical protein
MAGIFQGGAAQPISHFTDDKKIDLAAKVPIAL